MRDPQIDKLAKVLVEYSCNIKPGEMVRITGDPVSTPLLEALFEHCLRAGAHPFVKSTPASIQDIFLELADEEQLKYLNPLVMREIETIDVSFAIWAEVNTKSLSRIDPARQSMNSAARRPIFQTFMERAARKELKWCGTLFPTLSNAQDAEMSLRQYEEFVFVAGRMDKADPVAEWRKIEARQQKVVDFLTGKNQVRFQADNGTDLVVDVSGMTWINCCGHENFPDGEVFTGPNLKAADGGVNGVVKFSFPAVHNGREVHDIQLTFERGKVVDARASKNQDFLIKMLDQDPGARYMGEIAIGTNYNITQYTKNTLFDEKIGGTFHMAVGAGYPESGNTNASGLHWDMVCDLREGGLITVDGDLISKDGTFLPDGWPGNE